MVNNGPVSSQLDELREFEVREVLDLFPAGGRILEPGAGTGAQAAYLSSCGFTVEALEIESSEYRNARVFPVRDYDGRVFPFNSNSFNAVYTSNVLEHVPDLPAFLAECRRVLIDGGVMIMVVPTASWRLWSIPAYYPARVRELLTPGSSESSSDEKKRSLRLSSFFPSTHGERGNAITEVWCGGCRAGCGAAFFETLD